MNRLRVLSLSLTAVAVLSASAALVNAAAPAADKAVERGKYLVMSIGCNDCHTPGTFYGAPDFSRFLSGSEMGWAGPWGVVYAANLTPDPETGLGKWSKEEIAKAIRSGNRPDGRQLAVAMPWMNFSHLTDGDAMAIAAYLKSLPPVKHAVPKPLAPGAEVTGPVLSFPPPSAWDAPREAAAEPKK